MKLLIASIIFSALSFASSFEINAPISNLKYTTKVSDNLFAIFNAEKKLKTDFIETNKIEVQSLLSQSVPNADQAIMNKDRANQILHLLRNNPIAGSNQIDKYDPEKEVGFCFGRATYVHMELLRHGVAPDHIVKVFAMGNLKYEKTKWDFHAAVAVWSQENNWLVIDELVNEILPLEQWMTKLIGFAQKPEKPDIRFFMTDPAKFHPALGAYQRKDMIFDYYHNYFLDLDKWLKKNPVKANQKFGPLPH